jgi:hypothetical protein
MRQRILGRLAVIGALGMAVSVHAGTTAIDFTQGIGNLVRLGGSGTLTTDVNCRAVMGGTTTWVVGNGVSPVTSSGTTSITVGISPGNDLTVSQEFGLIVVEPASGEFVTATVNDLGDVTLTNGLETDTAFFPAPGASNAGFTLTYNQTTDTATVTITGFSNSATISPAIPLGEGGPVQIGVFATGGAEFRSLTATGAGIPELDSTGVCGAEEGETEGTPAEGEEEGEAPVIVAVGGGFIESGDRLELTLVGADGAIGYQWTKNNVDLPSDTGASLVRNPVNSVDSGTYRCEVDLGAKTVVVSAPVLVTVVPPGGLPVAGGIGMALLAGALALAGLGRRCK